MDESEVMSATWVMGTHSWPRSRIVLMYAGATLVMLICISFHHYAAIPPPAGLASRRLVAVTDAQSGFSSTFCHDINVSIEFKMVASRSQCADDFLSESAYSPKACALACMSQPGCSAFSFEEDVDGNGCRISACTQRVGRDCFNGRPNGIGNAGDDYQCLVSPSQTADLYSLQAFRVVAMNVRCQHQYVPHSASSPACCAAACQAKQHCKIFSFSFNDGCRLSACMDEAAVGGAASCSPRHQCSIQSALRERPLGKSSFMYSLLQPISTRKTIQTFRRMALPIAPVAATVGAAAPLLMPTLPPITSTAAAMSTSAASLSSPQAPQVAPTAGTPLSLNGSFVASGIGLTKPFMQTLLKQTLEKVFQEEKAFISSQVSNASISVVKLGADEDNFQLSFLCTFQVCTKAVFFDRAYFLTLLYNYSETLARYSHMSNGTVEVDKFQAASTYISCQGVPELNLPISFGILGKGGACYAHHLVKATATTLDACSHVCAAQPGCVVFSFGGTAGCRISSCSNPKAKRASAALSCGHSEGGTPTLRAQCATRPYVGSNVFFLIGLQVIGVHVGCDYKYVPFPTFSPSRCSQACQADSQCNVFSFSSHFGCRLSACLDPLSVGTNFSCVGGHGHHLGVLGQCITESRNSSYLYALTLPKLVETTVGPPGMPGPVGSGGFGGGGGAGSVSSSDSGSNSGSSNPLAQILSKVWLPVTIVIACILIIACVALVMKKCREDERLKGYMELCQKPLELCKKQNGVAITFDTGKGTVIKTFSELPLSLSFWDEVPLRVCKVKENCEAQRLGVKEGWIATHVNGKLLVGDSATQLVATLNKTALRSESVGGMRRMAHDADS